MLINPRLITLCFADMNTTILNTYIFRDEFCIYSKLVKSVKDFVCVCLFMYEYLMQKNDPYIFDFYICIKVVIYA